jgi:hypothetical protein
MSALPPHEEYEKRMSVLGFGCALWNPSPDIVDGVWNPPTQVGDVGYIWNGKWRYLLNIHLPAGHQEQAPHLPASFVPLPREDVSQTVRYDSMQWTPSKRHELKAGAQFQV